MKPRGLNQQPIAAEDSHTIWARRRAEAQVMDKKLIEIALEVGADIPTHEQIRQATAATAAGDPWKLRGLPAIGGRGSVGGAIRGTKPGSNL